MAGAKKAKGSKIPKATASSSTSGKAKLPKTTKKGSKGAGSAEVDSGVDEEEYWAQMEKEAAEDGIHDKNSGNDSSDDDDSGSDSEDEIKLQDIVTHKSEEYTFEFNDMREGFTEGICTLLQSNYLGNPTAAYSAAQAVTAQSIVGTAIVCEGAEDVFAFATVLPLKREQLLSTLYTTLINPLATQLLEDKSNKMDKERKDLMLRCVQGVDRGKTGLLIHKRFTNLPLELIGHLHKNLDEDLGWAKSMEGCSDGSGDGSTVDAQVDFKEMTSVLLLASCELNGQATHGKTGGNKVLDVTGSSSSLLFDYFEDDVYMEEAEASFYYRPGAHTTTGLAAILLPVSSFKSCTNKIIKMIPAK